MSIKKEIKKKDPKDSKLNHFFIGYAGNKRKERSEILEEILKNDINNIKTIIEPYCGTSAISYYLSLHYPKRFQYVLNDNNNHLIDLYKIASDEEKLKELVEKLNNLIIGLDKEKYNKIIKENTTEAWIIKNKIYAMRAGLFPTTKKTILQNFNYMFDCPMINFLRTEKIILKNIDGVEILKEYGNKKDCLLFIDPPYLTECNDYYHDSNVNIYEYLYNNNIKSFTSNILLVLSNNWIIKLLFKDDIKNTYDKKYEGSKKKTDHFIISNRKE